MCSSDLLSPTGESSWVSFQDTQDLYPPLRPSRGQKVYVASAPPQFLFRLSVGYRDLMEISSSTINDYSYFGF